MQITFHGAAREVTGSMHLVTTEHDRLLLDCGIFQGHRKECEIKNRNFPIDPGTLTNLILSHAHMDHSGRIPVLTREKFGGRVICTRPTAAACEYLLMDSAHIQEMDAQYLNYKAVRKHLHELKQDKALKTRKKKDFNEIKRMLKKGRHELDSERVSVLMKKYNLPKILPLYSGAEAEQALTFFDAYPYRQPVTVGQDVTCKFYDAGHILGSAFTFLKVREKGRTLNICYTGDMGRFGKPILEDPTLDFDEEDREVDLLIMESTYGNRFHEPVKDLKSHLEEELNKTFKRGGTVLIPSFAFGRTQELIYFLHELYLENRVPKVPVYIDSPLAINLTKVFGEHPEAFDAEAHADFLQKGANPFFFKEIHFTATREESMALLREKGSHIILAGSGMCEGGRMVHHLRYKIHDAKNTILIVGYMAQHTLGRRILEAGREFERADRKGPAPELKFLRKTYPLNAHVREMGGFSAHADRDELCRLLKESNLKIKQIALVHGEEEQILPLSEHLKGSGFTVNVPEPGGSITL